MRLTHWIVHDAGKCQAGTTALGTVLDIDVRLPEVLEDIKVDEVQGHIDVNLRCVHVEHLNCTDLHGFVRTVFDDNFFKTSLDGETTLAAEERSEI